MTDRLEVLRKRFEEKRQNPSPKKRVRPLVVYDEKFFEVAAWVDSLSFSDSWEEAYEAWEKEKNGRDHGNKT